MLKSYFILAIGSMLFFPSCYFADYFEEKPEAKAVASELDVEVLGEFLGVKAGDIDESSLAAIHDITSSIPPASIRLDPDLYPRMLLRQYREEGTTIARKIGEIQGYRLLLGGAPEDFLTSVKSDVDATAFLAAMQVGKTICEALVAPSDGIWYSILPASPRDYANNLIFLAQRFSGVPTSSISDEKIAALKAILDAYTPDGDYTWESYIPVCMGLNVDPEWVWL